MIEFILIFLSAYFTHFIAHTRQMHRVTSSALGSIILIALIRMLAINFPAINLSLASYEVAIFGASFLGMSTHHRIEYKTLWFSILLFYILLKSSFLVSLHLGGTLGLMAFVSTVSTVLISDLLRKKSKIFSEVLVKE